MSNYNSQYAAARMAALETQAQLKQNEAASRLNSHLGLSGLMEDYQKRRKLEGSRTDQLCKYGVKGMALAKAFRMKPEEYDIYLEKVKKQHKAKKTLERAAKIVVVSIIIVLFTGAVL